MTTRQAEADGVGRDQRMAETEMQESGHVTSQLADENVGQPALVAATKSDVVDGSGCRARR